MITATVVGNVGKQPELKTTNSGKQMTTFGVASTYKTSGREPVTTWVDVVCFEEAAAQACEQLSKGDRVVVTGRLQLERYERNDGSEGTSLRLLADEVAKSVRFPKRETAAAF